MKHAALIGSIIVAGSLFLTSCGGGLAERLNVNPETTPQKASPADSFETTLARLRAMRASGTHVLTDTVSGQDVTDQYIDLDAQYRNLSATHDAYQKLLEKATTVSDIITLTREVANIQTQMDQI